MSYSFVRILKAAALMAIGGTAMMQAGEQASFHLSVVTHWGGATLQPGDYKMSLPDEAVNQSQIKVQGEGKTVYIFPIVADITRGEEGSSRLNVIEANGKAYVQDLLSSAEGKEYRFFVPKSKNRIEALAKRTTSVAVN